LTESPNFEYNLLKILVTWIADEYLSGVDEVYEFGCGPSYHLVHFAELYPLKKYYGLD